MTADVDQSGRARFDTLFAERRHFRGDCQLLCRAVRAGWLADATQADRDEIMERFLRASAELHGEGADRCSDRAVLAEIEALAQLHRANFGPLAPLPSTARPARKS